MFQHTAARRRLLVVLWCRLLVMAFQHTAARRRLHLAFAHPFTQFRVSTHSRPKAAASATDCRINRKSGFNTQPPEGGCICITTLDTPRLVFQHTAARRRLPSKYRKTKKMMMFQHTAARRRLPMRKHSQRPPSVVSTHSRPKAAAKTSC